uniref:Uncharacterized protein n=1 Tax=Rhizophora mucronata TaxID=61149 RepID=A0A2P2PQD5_RHIMU
MVHTHPSSGKSKGRLYEANHGELLHLFHQDLSLHLPLIGFGLSFSSQGCFPREKKEKDL